MKIEFESKIARVIRLLCHYVVLNIFYLQVWLYLKWYIQALAYAKNGGLIQTNYFFYVLNIAQSDFSGFHSTCFTEQIKVGKVIHKLIV